MFHTMSHTCISEVLLTLRKPLLPKHQLITNTEQERESSPVHTTPKKFENAAALFLRSLRPTVHTDPVENEAFRKVNALQT